MFYYDDVLGMFNSIVLKCFFAVQYSVYGSMAQFDANYRYMYTYMYMFMFIRAPTCSGC